MLMSAEERSGWRDEALSLRHRLWGYDCPAVDIDFLLIEYDKAEPKALVEYKNEHAQPITISKNSSILAMIELANRAELPALLVRYADDFSWWKVAPLNHEARQQMPPKENDSQSVWYFDEVQFVTLLYSIRGRQIPPSIVSRINELHTSGGDSQ